jgi:hypothetical protein
MGAILNYYENSQRFWKVKVSTSPAINEKVLIYEVFSYFVEMLLGCCLQSYNEFLLNVHFEV